MGNAYDFKKVERRSGTSVQSWGFIRKKYLLLVGLSISGMILFAIFGGRGLMQIYHLKEERNRIEGSNARLQEENRKLTEKVNRLRNNKDEVEKVAREELGLVKKGEVVYQFEK
jgi:cell division protein FtsB